MSGRGAGLLGARGGWAERERTGGEKGDGPRAWAAGESAGPAQGKGKGRVGLLLGWVLVVGLGLFSILLSISIYSLISNLSQTKVEFK